MVQAQTGLPSDVSRVDDADLMARKVIPHFKGQLAASRSSHDWAKDHRDQLIGRAGEAVVKAITEHVGEQEGAVN